MKNLYSWDYFFFQFNSHAQSQFELAENYTKAETQFIVSNQYEKGMAVLIVLMVCTYSKLGNLIKY
jgi:hypothetical protein